MDLVKNQKIKKLLFDRWKELGLRAADIISDASERGMKIRPASMSRYKNGVAKETISADQLLWLCTRYGIFVSFNIGEPVGPVKYEVKPYDEAKCLSILANIYGKK